MKVLFLARLYYPHIGGVERHVKSISESLSLRKHKVTMITEKYDSKLPTGEKIDGIEVVRFSYPKIKYLGLLYIWLWFLKNASLIKQSDVVHCHDIFIWYLPFRFLFPKKPVYTTFHGWEGIWPIPKKSLYLKRLAAKLSFGTIGVGKRIKTYYGIDLDLVVYGGVDLPRKTFRKEKGRILYLGRLYENTGIRIVLKALSELKNYKIDFCGDGPLRAECSKYGAVHGFSDPRPFLEKAEICIASGYLAMMEAFSYKCLVASVYDTKAREAILKLTPFSDWMIVENSDSRLAKKIRYFLGRPKQRKEKVEKVYNWVKKQTWEMLADQYIRLYKK